MFATLVSPVDHASLKCGSAAAWVLVVCNHCHFMSNDSHPCFGGNKNSKFEWGRMPDVGPEMMSKGDVCLSCVLVMAPDLCTDDRTSRTGSFKSGTHILTNTCCAYSHGAEVKSLVEVEILGGR